MLIDFNRAGLRVLLIAAIATGCSAATLSGTLAALAAGTPTPNVTNAA